MKTLKPMEKHPPELIVCELPEIDKPVIPIRLILSEIASHIK